MGDLSALSGAAAKYMLELLTQEAAGISRRSAYRAVAELRRRGWVTRAGNGWTPTALFFSLLPPVYSSGNGEEERMVEEREEGGRSESHMENKDIYTIWDSVLPDPPNSARPPQISEPVRDHHGEHDESVSVTHDTSVPPMTQISATHDTCATHDTSERSSSATHDTLPETLLDALLEADQLPLGDGSMKPGSPFVRRRRAQTSALQRLWVSLFPERPLSQASAGRLIRAAQESSYLVGLCVQDMETKGERITSPVGYVVKAIESAVLQGWMLPAQAQAEDALEAPSEEYLALLAETQRAAASLWRSEDE